MMDPEEERVEVSQSDRHFIGTLELGFNYAVLRSFRSSSKRPALQTPIKPCVTFDSFPNLKKVGPAVTTVESRVDSRHEEML